MIQNKKETAQIISATAKGKVRNMVSDPDYYDYVDNIISKNASKNFVKRIIDPSLKLDLGNGDYATHKMSYAEVDGKFIVYPNVVQKKGSNSLVELNGRDAIKYALDNNEYVDFDNEEDASKFAESGYKIVWGNADNPFLNKNNQ